MCINIFDINFSTYVCNAIDVVSTIYESLITEHVSYK